MNRIVAFTTGAAAVLVASTAAAAPPFTEEKVSISGHVGYGVALDDDEIGDLNPYGLGFGARGGYTLDPNIYLGALFDFFLGETEEVDALGVNVGEASANAWLFQIEGGYDFGVSRAVVLRPKLGLGMTQINAEACAEVPFIGEECQDDSESDFSFAFGLEAPIDLDAVYIAPELRFSLGDDVGAFILAVGIGGAF